MELYKLRLELQSETTFGRGDGLAGVVDREVEHDPFGLPYLRGRTLKGLLAEECANMLYVLKQQQPRLEQKYMPVAARLFGQPGSGLEQDVYLYFGDAVLPHDLRLAVQAEVEQNHISRLDVLEALTDIRRQTAVDETGVPDPHSLRSMRVILPELFFEADLIFTETPTPEAINLLNLCAMALRRAGTGRNRGRGRIKATLFDPHKQPVRFEPLREELLAS
ncbi:MAG: RAMP superfamily protein [Anaerolineae bacterium]|nr:RAMP superfamily protein [Anaerolineae bacterium]